MKYWEILLIEHRNRGKDGLTLPFLIGSQDFFEDSRKKQNNEELIIDMAESRNFETCIRYCLSIETLIFEIRKTKNAVYYPDFNGHDQKNLSIGLFLKAKLGMNVIGVISYLKENFQQIIENQVYSAINQSLERKGF